MHCRIVDTTLRDGEQMAGVAFNLEQKLKIASYLDSLGIYQIEAGTPAMEGEEKDSIKAIVKLNLNSRISAWNRLNINDIDKSMECGVDIIHISVPSSQIQIKNKLKKDEKWLICMLEECIEYVVKSGFDISIGLEDASRAEEGFLEELCSLCTQKGVIQIRYADTLGIMTPAKTYNVMKKLLRNKMIDLEFHGHNDFGMVIANTMAAIAAGVKYVDCTLGGIGERTGNCDYDKLIMNMDLI